MAVPNRPWNQDIREIVAEFAADDELLMRLRLLSSEWCAAVTAGVARVSELSVVRATLCPAVVMETPTDAEVDVLIRASFILSKGRAVDLAVFPKLRGLDLVGFFSSSTLSACVHRRGKAARLLVNLSSLVNVSELPDLNMRGIAGNDVELRLPTTLTSLSALSLMSASLGRVDLSQATALASLPAFFMNEAAMDELLLPVSVTSMGQCCFNAAKLSQLDLSGLTSLTALPAFFMIEASVAEIRLPTSLTALGPCCFVRAKLLRLDLSQLTSLTSLPDQFMDGTTLNEICFPSTLTALGEHCLRNVDLSSELVLPANVRDIGRKSFDSAKLLRVDLTNLTSVATLPDRFMSEATVRDELLLPATVTALGDLCLQAATLPRRLDLSHLEALTTVPASFMFEATVDDVLFPRSVTTFGKACFACATLTRLDLSHLESLTSLPARFLSEAAVDELLLPMTIASMGHGCFGSAKLKIVDLSHMTSLISLPSSFMRGATAEEIFLPPTVTALGQGTFESSKIRRLTLPAAVVTFSECCFKSARLGRLDLSRLKSTVFGLPPSGFLRDAVVDELLMPPGVTKPAGMKPVRSKTGEGLC